MVVSHESASEVLEALRRALVRSVGPAGEPVVLYSGGLDSSLLAHLLHASGRRPRLLTLGTRGAPDPIAARRGAALLGLPLKEAELSDPELTEGWTRWKEMLGAEREPARSVLWALALGIERASAQPVVVGQGADELFGGYHHFEGLAVEAAERRSQEDLRRLLATDWPKTEAIAARVGRVVRAPYLDPDLGSALMALAAEERLAAPPRKRYLRELARRAGLPEELASRPKRAFQYGSGVAKWLHERVDVAPRR